MRTGRAASILAKLAGAVPPFDTVVGPEPEVDDEPDPGDEEPVDEPPMTWRPAGLLTPDWATPPWYEQVPRPSLAVHEPSRQMLPANAGEANKTGTLSATRPPTMAPNRRFTPGQIRYQRLYLEFLGSALHLRRPYDVLTTEPRSVRAQNWPGLAPADATLGAEAA